jgi:hypothetical protein
MGVVERVAAEVATQGPVERARADGRELAAQVGLAELGVRDAGDAERPGGQRQGVGVGYGAEDEMGMGAGGGDQAPPAGLHGGVDRLHGLVGRGQVGPDDGIDVADAP